MSLSSLRVLACAVLLLTVPGVAFGQRELHWDSVDVAAHLDASGSLRVTETQAMVFTGDWNGGERRFDIRPRQKLSFIGLYRGAGGSWRELTEDPGLDSTDDYAWAGRNTLRWRSRNASDPAFLNTHLQYQLRYELSGILLKRDNGYLLDHDFLFPERNGIVGRFVLRLTLDPAWQPASPLQDEYRSARLPPGRGFVLTLPLHYAGTGMPAVLDTSRPPEVLAGLWCLLGLSGLAAVGFFVREQQNGRFAPVADSVDEAWLREHVLDYPAEVVGAAWDGEIGSSEVVALIARMVGEGKLETDVDAAGSMTLRLEADRKTLEGRERTLVERLFFDGRTETSTGLVKEHYRDRGFDPAREISSELEAAVQEVLPKGTASRPLRFTSPGLMIAGSSLLLVDWLAGNVHALAAALMGIGALLLAAIAWGIGLTFRANIDWGRRVAFWGLTPGIVAVGAVSVYLWFYAGPGVVYASPVLVVALVALALGVMFACTGGMRSRQSRAAIAFRKNLAAARAFFISELAKTSPALRDEWYPWLLAFGLRKEMDDWSAPKPAPAEDAPPRSRPRPGESPTAEPSSQPRWTGFGGGRSGGAGATGSWAAAAGGVAEGVPASRPASSSGDDSSGGGSSDTGSSSGGSSGGGGGGGW
jgi:hypothetical protein